MQDEQQIRRIVREEVNRITNKSRFEMKSIPRHAHDGIDSLKIIEDNIILTQKLIAQLILDSSETFTLRNVYNVGRISFHGIAYQSPLPTTKKASISGEVIFGKCAQFTGSGSSIAISALPIVSSEVNGNTSAFVQSSNYVYLDTGNLINSGVGSSAFLVEVLSEGLLVARLTLNSYKGDDLQFTVMLAENWILNGTIIIE